MLSLRLIALIAALGDTGVDKVKDFRDAGARATRGEYVCIILRLDGVIVAELAVGLRYQCLLLRELSLS